MRQKGYWIDMALLAAVVICLTLIAMRYLRDRSHLQYAVSAIREIAGPARLVPN
jgi:hypothetical protein